MVEADPEAIERRRLWHIAARGYDRTCPKCGGWAKEMFYLPTPPKAEDINWQCEKCERTSTQASEEAQANVAVTESDS